MGYAPYWLYGSRVASVRLFDTTSEGADLRAALVASCLRGAFPPVDLRAVCFVRAIVGVLFQLFSNEISTER